MQPIYYFCIINNSIEENLHTKHMGSFSMQDIVYNTI